MAILTNLGLDEVNQVVLGKIALSNWVLRLYTNNYVPNLNSIPANFTELPNTLYTPVTLLPANWTGATAGGVTQYSYAQVNWTIPAYSGPVLSVYGYFVTSVTSGNCLFAEAAVVPFALPLTGATLSLILQWTDQNL